MKTTTTMTKESLAALLNGREYNKEITDSEAEQAENAGLVVVFGASDDLMEFEGAIYDEADCYNGGTILLDKEGLLEPRSYINEDDDEALEKWLNRKRNSKVINAIWEKDGISWQYETSIPHATFHVMEDGVVYCRGIVFALADL